MRYPIAQSILNRLLHSGCEASDLLAWQETCTGRNLWAKTLRLVYRREGREAAKWLVDQFTPAVRHS